MLLGGAAPAKDALVLGFMPQPKKITDEAKGKIHK